MACNFGFDFSDYKFEVRNPKFEILPTVVPSPSLEVSRARVMQDDYRIEMNMTDRALRNRVRVRQIFQNFGFLSFGKMLGDICTFFLFVVLSRAFGQEGIGQYSFAMALIGFFVVFSDFGLYSFSIKELSRKTDALGAYYGNILSVRLILSLIMFTAILIMLPFLPFSTETKMIIVVIGANQLIYKILNGFGALCVAVDKPYLAGLLQFSYSALTALVGSLVVLFGGSLVVTLATLPAITAGLLLVSYRTLIRGYGPIRIEMSFTSMIRTLREAGPFALSGILSQFYSRIDVVCLGFFLGAAAAGVYNVAYRVVFLLLYTLRLVATSILPVASRLYLESERELEQLYHQAVGLTILIGIPLAAGVWLIAGPLVEFVFGEGFSESAAILRLLSALLFVGFMRGIMNVFLMATDRQTEMAKCQWAAVALNIVGNLLLIPGYGIKGAAAATLLSDSVLLLLLAVRVRRVLGWPRVGYRFAMSAIGTSSFCILFSVYQPLPLGIVIASSIVIYVLILVSSRDIRGTEFKTVLNIVREGH